MTSKEKNLQNFLFAISFFLFAFSLFNRDVSNVYLLEDLTTLLKYLSLGILIFDIMFSALKMPYSKSQILGLLVLFIIDIIIAINSGVITFFVITLFISLALKLEDRIIIKTAFFTLLILLFLVLILYASGFYQDIITNRYVGTSTRHSLGFSHSNVFPLTYSYLVGYYLLKDSLQKKYVLILIIGDVILFLLCGSRNAFAITLFLIFAKLFINSKIYNDKIKAVFDNFILIIAKFSVFFLSIVSISLPLLLGKIGFISFLDEVLSFRFTSILSKIQIYGLHLLPKITNQTFFSDGIVIDNGYAFLAIRYGLVLLFFLGLSVYFVAKKYKKNIFILILIILVSITNFIDNDIIDYCCLPYLLLIGKCLIETMERVFDRNVRVDQRNNEYI